MAAEDDLTPFDFQLALEVQDHCDLEGVARSFSRLFPRILAEARNKKKGAEWVNAHPICVLYTNKMVNLAGEPVLGGILFNEAYDTCLARSKDKDGKRL